MSNVDMWARAWHTCMGRLLCCLLFADLSHPITTAREPGEGRPHSHWLRQWARVTLTG